MHMSKRVDCKRLTLCPLGAEVRVQSDEGQGAVEVKKLPSLSWTPPPVL